MTAELTYFTVTGHWYDVSAPDSTGSTNTPTFAGSTANVTFTPRIAPGTAVYISGLDLDGGTTYANTAVTLAPVLAQINGGELETINAADTAGVQLVANSAALSLPTLIYDVSFTGIDLANFAFTAPTDATPVDLTDPALTKLPYDPTSYA